MAEEVREFNGKKVTRCRVIGTDHIYFQAWEPVENYWESHSCCRGIDGEPYGELTRRHLPECMEDMPSFSEERLKAVHAYHAMLEKEAQWHIVGAYPELAEDLTFSGGEGRLRNPEEYVATT